MKNDTPFIQNFEIETPKKSIHSCILTFSIWPLFFYKKATPTLLFFESHGHM